MPNKASVFTYDGVNGVGSFACPAACRAVVNTQSGDYTPTVSDYFVHFTGAGTCTLDSTLPVGTTFMIKVCGACTVNIVPSSGLVDNITNFPLVGTDAGTVLLPSGDPVYYPAVKCVFDGTNWWLHGYLNLVHKHIDGPSGGFIAPVLSTGLLSGLTSPTYGGPVLATFTVSVTGLYKLQSIIYPTTNNSSSWVVDVTARYQQPGQAQTAFIIIGQAQIQAYNSGNASLTAAPPALVYLASGSVINLDTKTDSGTKANGVYSVIIVIEHLG